MKPLSDLAAEIDKSRNVLALAHAKLTNAKRLIAEANALLQNDDLTAKVFTETFLRGLEYAKPQTSEEMF